MSATIKSVTFGEEHIEITYIEDFDQTEVAFLVRVLYIDSATVKEELVDALDSCHDLLDAGLLVKRNPPKKRPAREDLHKEDDDPYGDEVEDSSGGTDEADLDGEG